MTALSNKPYRPKVILDLKREIDERLRLVEFRIMNGLLLDKEVTKEALTIAELKLKLDDLYCLWVLGRLPDEDTGPPLDPLPEPSLDR